jgi:hypothetical protein
VKPDQVAQGRFQVECDCGAVVTVATVLDEDAVLHPMPTCSAYDELEADEFLRRCVDSARNARRIRRLLLCPCGRAEQAGRLGEGRADMLARIQAPFATGKLVCLHCGTPLEEWTERMAIGG